MLVSWSSEWLLLQTVASKFDKSYFFKKGERFAVIICNDVLP
jgi:hypothetical protein